MPAQRSILAWAFAGGMSQIVGTAPLLRTMRERNFAVGVAYSKTDIVQVAIFSLVLLGERLDAVAVAAGRRPPRSGVLLLAPADRGRPLASLVEGLASRSALLGLACGAGMAMASVAFRAATQVAGTSSWLLDAALTVVVAQPLQTLDARRLAVVRARATSSCARCARGGPRCSPGSWARPRRPRGSPRSPSSR